MEFFAAEKPLKPDHRTLLHEKRGDAAENEQIRANQESLTTSRQTRIDIGRENAIAGAWTTPMLESVAEENRLCRRWPCRCIAGWRHRSARDAHAFAGRRCQWFISATLLPICTVKPLGAVLALSLITPYCISDISIPASLHHQTRCRTFSEP